MPDSKVTTLREKVGQVSQVKEFQESQKIAEENRISSSPLTIHLKGVVGSLISYLIALHKAQHNLVIICETEEELQFIEISLLNNFFNLSLSNK